MKTVRAVSKTLKASVELQSSLAATGDCEHFHAASVLFRAGDENSGVFLVRNGKVCLHVPNAPELDRTFSAGSVLGLPSTFIGRPYSLSATAVTDSHVVHMRREDFLKLMGARTDLCREATELLSHEVRFLLTALGNRQPTHEARSAAAFQ